MCLIKHCAKKIYKKRLYILGNSTAGKLHKLYVPAVLLLRKESFIEIVIILTGLSYSVPQYKEGESERVEQLQFPSKIMLVIWEHMLDINSMNFSLFTPLPAEQILVSWNTL